MTDTTEGKISFKFAPVTPPQAEAWVLATPCEERYLQLSYDKYFTWQETRGGVRIEIGTVAGLPHVIMFNVVIIGGKRIGFCHASGQIAHFEEIKKWVRANCLNPTSQPNDSFRVIEPESFQSCLRLLGAQRR